MLRVRHAPMVPLLAVCLGVMACASALKEPPPLPQLGGGGPSAASGEVEALLSRADVLYAARTLEGVRKAAQTWLEAARADSSRIEGLVGTARAEVWLVDHEPEAASKEAAATLAVQAAQWCLRQAPGAAECSFWLGAALGVQAREKRSTALDALPRIEQSFLKAAEQSPEMEDAGPDRALALLYLRAPGWPAGPGDPARGLEHARKAVKLEPEFPPNLLALAEALGATGDPEGARQNYSQALKLARSMDAAGDPDAADWIREATTALERGSAGP